MKAASVGVERPGRPTRRTVVLGGAAAAVAGCGIDLGAARRDDGVPAPRRPDRDERARRRAVEDARALLAVTAAVPPVDDGAVASLLAEVAAVCGRHLVALRPAGAATDPSTDPSTGLPTGLPTAEPSAQPTAQPTARPTDPPQPPDVVARLGAATATALRDAARAGGPTARLLASVGAARAVLAARLAAAVGISAPARPVTDDDGATAATTPDAPSAATAAVTGERAAAYGYGVLATRLGGQARERAVTVLGEHTRAADALAAAAQRAGAEVAATAAPPAWQVPGPVADTAAAVALATDLEQRTAAAHADLVAASAGGLRAAAVEALVAAAGRRAAWTGTVEALPGLREPAEPAAPTG